MDLHNIFTDDKQAVDSLKRSATSKNLDLFNVLSY